MSSLIAFNVFSGILNPLKHLFLAVLEWLHYSANLPWAWAIVVLTVIVRIVIVPLTVKQIHSMQSLQAHAPEMKEIQQRYKHDKQRQQQELMRFYKENNINPMASCLPMLAQFPIFIALYFVLKDFSANVPCRGHAANPNFCVTRGDFSWLGHDLFPNIAKNITWHWSGYVLLVIYVGSQVASTYFMSGTAQKSQRVMMMVLPFVILPFILRFPVGLVLYWATTNLWTVGQGLITRTLIPKPPPPVKRSSRTPAALAKQTVEQPRAPQGPRRVKRKKKKGGGRR
ncbi:MAG TPA: YidC/Oxa1 family membrane protein insertase [Gaiellaceae bacterium]